MLVIKDKTKNKFIEIGNIVQPLKNDLTQVEAGKYALDAAQGYKLNGDIAEKLDKNLGATESGKYLNIASDGAITPADLPIASANELGVVKVSTGGSGVIISNNGMLQIARPTNQEISSKASSYKPIVPSNLDYAVKSGLADSKIEWSETERASARARLGVNYDDAEYELIEDFTFTSDDEASVFTRQTTPSGVAYNLKKLCVFFKIPANSALGVGYGSLGILPQGSQYANSISVVSLANNVNALKYSGAVVEIKNKKPIAYTIGNVSALSNNGAVNTVLNGMGALNPDWNFNKICGIKFNMGGTGKLVAGVNIKIYGVWA